MSDRLTLDGVEVDINTSVSFPLDFSIADIKEPQKKKRSVSKTIILPGTVNNLDFFSSTYQLSLFDKKINDIGFSFNPSRRVTAKYFKSDVLVFDGLLQFNSVGIVDKSYSFECVLYSNFLDVFIKLGDLKVSELGWSEYNHELTIENVKNSWDTSVILNGVPSSNFTGFGVPDGYGYLYPLVDYGYPQDFPLQFPISNLVPMVYVKEVIEKCFDYSEMSIDSSFMNTDLFKGFMLGFGGGNKLGISPIEINSRMCDIEGVLSLSTDTTLNVINNGEYYRYQVNKYYNVLINPNFIETINQDNYSQYDPLTGSLTILKSGTYLFSFKGFLDVVITDGVDFVSGGTNNRFSLHKNGIELSHWSYVPNNNTDFSEQYGINQTVFCSQGDVITLKYQLYASLTYLSESSVSISAGSSDLTFVMSSANSNYLDGDVVDISLYIPEIKCVDFLNSIILAFNLYMSDPTQEGEVTIEPLPSFYRPTNEFQDWSNLIDYSKEVKILPTSSIDGKTYTFSFQEENDFDNINYKNEYGSIYGNRSFVVESSFQTGLREYKLKFGQAIPTQIPNSKIVLPRIIELKDGKITPYKGKPKIYCYNRLKAGNFMLTNIAGNVVEVLNEYPCVHHFDDIDNPTFDFNWELVKEIYYGNFDTKITTNNLFSAYHEKFIREITSRDSKIMQCYVKLNNFNIFTLDFSKLVMINGVLFRLNEIKNFDPNVVGSTFVELIKIIEADSPSLYYEPMQYKLSKAKLMVSPVDEGLGNEVIEGGISNTKEVKLLIG